MTHTSFLQFDGLNAPVALTEAAPLSPLIAQLFPGWPHRETPTAEKEPFFTIKAQGPGSWQVISRDQPDKTRTWDAVNALCDLIAEMAWERLRSAPQALCLHAAAVRFGDRLIAFPSVRRSGKSTLSIALAHLGQDLYSDDVLPVTVDPETKVLVGQASGIAPRLRLPVPSSFGAPIRAWIDRDPGPSNRQYKYLLTPRPAPFGSALPLGAIVVLDRHDTDEPPRLSPLAPQDALASLVEQNFARALHAGSILLALERLSQSVPAFKLTYRDADRAAALLADHPDLQSLPTARLQGHPGPQALADLALEPASATPFDPAKPYWRAPGLTETEVGDRHFIADGAGRGIYQLNAGSALIWRLLAEPMTVDQVSQTLAAVFEDVPAKQIEADTLRTMTDLALSHLIAPAPDF